MNLQKSQQEEPEVNLTSLIDVVFLLLIFFMVTTTFQRQAQLRIDLPEASSEPQAQTVETLEIVINAEGRYYLDGNELVNTRADTLSTALIKEADNNYDRPVSIRADARTPHQSVVTALDVLSKLGFINLSIATTQVTESG